MTWSAAVAGCALALALAGCAGETDGPVTADATGVPTLTPVSAPPRAPASGLVLADLRQSSRDAAAGQMQVWLDNDTLDDLEPTEIIYTDPRLTAPVVGERLREMPARAERGFPLPLPLGVVCDLDGPLTGSLSVTFADATTRTLPVADSVDIVGRHVDQRCQERAIAQVATLAWADTVTTGPVAPGDDATLTLVVMPAGGSGRLRIDTVSGTPVLAAVGDPFWTVDRTIGGGDPTTRIDLPLKPNRCDPHAFLESGGATAFRVKAHLDGDAVEVVLRMSPAGAAAAIDFAQRSCGF